MPSVLGNQAEISKCLLSYFKIAQNPFFLYLTNVSVGFLKNLSFKTLFSREFQRPENTPERQADLNA